METRRTNLFSPYCYSFTADFNKHSVVRVAIILFKFAFVNKKPHILCKLHKICG